MTTYQRMSVQLAEVCPSLRTEQSRDNAPGVRQSAVSGRLVLFIVVCAAVPGQAQAGSPDCERRFSAPLVIATSTDGPSFVLAPDLDGDGDIDVVWASPFDRNIAWYENTDGLATFGPPRVIAAAAATGAVFAADLDGDGDIDIVSSSPEFGWWENIDGLGTFGPQRGIPTAGYSMFSVFAADLDGDGDNDVLSGSGGSTKITWNENVDGLGTFGPQRSITTSVGEPRSIFAADVDGDGDLDVVSASLEQYDKIAWYQNTDGLGTFGPQRIISTAALRPVSIFGADLDGDGDLDVLSASSSDDKIAWYQNTNGLGNFGPQRIISTAADYARSVFAADLDGDGDDDVLSASYSDDKIAWYENTDGLGTFGPQQVITTTADSAHSVLAADLDGDGDADVLSAFFHDDFKIAWYENDTDCNGNGMNDGCDVALGNALDCNANYWPDECDLASGVSPDCNNDSTPDECEADCNRNGVPDECDLADATSTDCNNDTILDECDIAWGTSKDCNANGVPDECDPNEDCNANSLQDICDIAAGTSLDCDGNGTPDECDLADGTSTDCNFDDVPDNCQPDVDCNANGVRDICDVGTGISEDCNFDLVPDDCQPNEDCETNGIRDLCDIGAGTALDCNDNLSPDACDIATGISADENLDGVPDECCPTLDAPLLEVEPEPKNRYLTVIPSPTWSGRRVGLRVTAITLDLFESSEGSSYWIGPPGDFPEEVDAQVGLTFTAAALQCEPYYHDWTAIDVLQAYGAVVVPSSVYFVQAVAEGCNVDSADSFSDPLVVTTSRFGEIVHRVPGTASRRGPDNTYAALYKFAALPNQPGWSRVPSKVLVQLQPNTPDPSQAISMRDVHIIADAESRKTYPLSGPETCPLRVPQCGDGVLDPSEECDDGNTAPGDGCDPQCLGENATFRMSLVPVVPAPGTGLTYPPGVTIDGNQITLPGGGIRLWFEVRISDWDPDLDMNPILRTVQAQIDAAGYTSAAKGRLLPVIPVTCEDSVDCQLVVGGGNCLHGFCYPAYYEYNRPDGLLLYASAVDSSTASFRFGHTALPGFSVGAADDGTAGYIGSLALDVSADAAGTFTIGFNPDPSATFALDDTLPLAIHIPIAQLEPAVVALPRACCLGASCIDAVEQECLRQGGTPINYCGGADDCNNNGIVDDCDLATGISGDCNANGVPDDCEPSEDCNTNSLQDICDIAAGTSADCNLNNVPDECEASGLEDCNNNGTVDLCDLYTDTSGDCNENSVPDECDIAAGTSLDEDLDGLPDECCHPPAAPLDEPDPTRKNRYMTVVPNPTWTGRQLALRVTPTLLPDYPSFENQPLWVGPPQAYPEEDTSQPGLTFMGASLQCQPYYQDWTTTGLLQIFGGEVIPGGEYEVQVIEDGCDLDFASSYSQPLTIFGAKFGDVVEPFAGDPSGPPQPDFKDIAAVVQKFTAKPGAPIKARAQFEPNSVIPSRPVDFKTIAHDVAAFTGTSYSAINIGPCDCPPNVICDTIPCSNDVGCIGSGVCSGGFCVDHCGRCMPP